MKRGEIWWVDLPDLAGSAPGGARPVVVVQANAFNRSRIRTMLAAVISSNERLAAAPGNVLLPAGTGGLRRISVVNVSQVVTLDKEWLRDRRGELTPEQAAAVDAGLRRVFGL